MPPLYRGTLTDTAIRPFVYLSDCPMAQLPEVRICPAIGTLATCSLAMCRLQARPRTDVDPPRVEPASAGDISSRRPRGDIFYHYWKK